MMTKTALLTIRHLPQFFRITLQPGKSPGKKSISPSHSESSIIKSLQKGIPCASSIDPSMAARSQSLASCSQLCVLRTQTVVCSFQLLVSSSCLPVLIRQTPVLSRQSLVSRKQMLALTYQSPVLTIRLFVLLRRLPVSTWQIRRTHTP